MSPEVCAAAGKTNVSAAPSTSAAAGWTIWRLVFDQRFVNRQVDHRSLPVIVFDQQHSGDRMVVLHFRRDADGFVAWIVVLGFLDRLAKLAGGAEHTVVLLLRFRQIVAAGDRIGLGDLSRGLID